MWTADTHLTERIDLVHAEYLESPGLHVTKPRVQRLWGVTSEALVAALVDVKFPKRTSQGAYVRADTR